MTTKQPTTGDIFYTIKTVRGKFEKAGFTPEGIEVLIAKRKENIKEEYPELYAEWEKLVGCRSGIKEDYGFNEWEVRTDIAGHFSITDYRTIHGEPYTEGSGDIGSVHVMSPYGMGFSEYIRPEAKNLDKLLAHVKHTVWLNKEEKEYLVNALETFR